MPTVDINLASCNTDPQPKTITFDLYNTLQIEKIIIKSTNTPGVIDIDQQDQPKTNRLKYFSDGRMEFKGTNGRNYHISKQPGLNNENVGFTKLIIQADCETPSE